MIRERGGFLDGFFGATMIIPLIGVYVFFGVVVWRFMRAHESIAESLKNVAENLKKEP